VTNNVKACIGKYGLVGQKTRREKFGHVFLFEGFCGGKQVTLELISVSKIAWLICSPGFLSISRTSK
jgi:hypothetical protein